MRAWDTTPGLGPKLCVAMTAFNRDILRILMSDFNQGQKETSLGTKERPCVIGMSVVIMDVEHSASTGFARLAAGGKPSTRLPPGAS